MREEGIVIEVSDDMTKVIVQSKQNCEHCNLCSRSEEGDLVIEAANPVSAAPGDRVVLEVSPGQIIKISLVVYILPLAALAGGVALGYFLADTFGISEKEDALGLALGAAGFIASVFALKAYDRHVAETNTARATIIEVV